MFHVARSLEMDVKSIAEACRAGNIPGHKRLTTEVGLRGLSIVRLVVSKPSGQEI